MTYHDYVTRRWFLKECGVGLGTIALHALLQDRAALAQGTSPSAAPERLTNIADAPAAAQRRSHSRRLDRFPSILPPRASRVERL